MGFSERPLSFKPSRGDDTDADDMGDDFNDSGKPETSRSKRRSCFSSGSPRTAWRRYCFRGTASQQAVEKLVAYLNLMKDTLPAGS